MIKFALNTEKSIRMLESENKLVFIVDSKDRKPLIKEEIQDLFKVKVDKIRTMYDSKGRKKAFVTFSEESPALDVATKLGLM